VGRPVLYGLANAGAAGAAHVLRLLLDEFAAAMALCGKRRVAELRDPALVGVPVHP
jgi:4-hydroxymandelate oxidase